MKANLELQQKAALLAILNKNFLDEDEDNINKDIKKVMDIIANSPSLVNTNRERGIHAVTFNGVFK
jgi:hypothetical protein